MARTTAMGGVPKSLLSRTSTPGKPFSTSILQFSEPVRCLAPMAPDLKGAPFPPTADSFQPSPCSFQKVLEKPKRPLSAYNIFFKVERQRMLDEQAAAATAACTAGRRVAKPQRVGFAELARTISQRWKQIDPQDKEELEHIAAIGRQIYYQEVEEWRRSTREMEEQGDNGDRCNYNSPNDSHHHHATVNNANNMASMADGFSHHHDVLMNNHYNEDVFSQEDAQEDFNHHDRHQQQQQQQHAPPTVHHHGGALFNDANNNHFIVPIVNNDGYQCHAAQ